MAERKPGRAKRAQWDAQMVRGLRAAEGLTQQELAERLGVRQQTISEWETGMYQPRGASATLLTRIAEDTGGRFVAPTGRGARRYPVREDPASTKNKRAVATRSGPAPTTG